MTSNLPSDLISIRDLIIPCLIGIFEEDKHQLHRLRFNIDLLLPHGALSQATAIDDTINYDSVIKSIKAMLHQRYIPLLEEMATRIVEHLHMQYRSLSGVKIRIEKMDLYPDAFPSVEITRYFNK